jgi:hypothetical protein
MECNKTNENSESEAFPTFNCTLHFKWYTTIFTRIKNDSEKVSKSNLYNNQITHTHTTMAKQPPSIIDRLVDLLQESIEIRNDHFGEGLAENLAILYTHIAQELKCCTPTQKNIRHILDNYLQLGDWTEEAIWPNAGVFVWNNQELDDLISNIIDILT